MEKTTWWAAVDKTGRFYAHPEKPIRYKHSGLWHNDKEFYHFLGLDFIHGMTWEDEPVEIDVIFKPKKNGNQSI